MQWNSLVTQLFGSYHGMRADGDFLQGEVIFEGEPLTVIGTTNHAPIGVASRAGAGPRGARHHRAASRAGRSCC